ncbi:porin family protein [Roseivirga sp. E12]|uniref:porin family protein n=1 Tax=Roseivirga sp. E12 TaxID=2819237 RepID=UPI001ABC5E44|nr:porin family protein [Roseivirga sp. E12]MBO3697061.1 PorT family protein [Roseivirga sp. E12]
MITKLKTLLLILVTMSLPALVSGQVYSTDHQAGAILKVVSARMNINSELVSTSSTESEVGYQFGGFYRVNIDRIYVQPEVLYSKIKTQLVFNDYNGVPGFNPLAQFEFNTLEIPINIGYRIGNLRLMMGPSFSILLSGERSFLNDVEKVTSEYNRSNFMWHWGIGGDFERIFIDIKYESGLSKTGESLSNLIGREFVPKQKQWVFSVALNLLRD